ncbi:ABC transporter substrate-binding protein/permease [Candidatus Leptofilum sp.]|uniref:ABC transporter substrate-binding protein/permease n=1 Tax=Candidatus Leptofilum sp. TaxID=3241576 RepID=UPI003B5B3B7F
MAGPDPATPSSLDSSSNRQAATNDWRDFPWWLVAILTFLGIMAFLIIRQPGPHLLVRIAEADEADTEEVSSAEFDNLRGVVRDDEAIVGVPTTGDALDLANEELEEERIRTFTELDEAAQALIDGEIDAVLLDRRTARTLVAENEETLTSVLAVPNAYNEAFVFIFPGITTTLYLTLGGFGLALVFGLLAGLGRISQNRVIRNIAITYVEFIRGVPTLVLILTLAFVIVPAVSDSIGIDNRDVSIELRAILALAIIYGAFLAEIFRAGIESISKGQMEAARSLGMTARQSMQYIILPQAIRNISPALGNDFIAMLKDSSLASVLAVRELTQRSRLHAGSTFRFPEAYLVIVFLYLAMTITLSLFLRWYERRIRVGEQ